jgi:hypothetical protein
VLGYDGAALAREAAEYAGPANALPLPSDAPDQLQQLQGQGQGQGQALEEVQQAGTVDAYGHPVQSNGFASPGGAGGHWRSASGPGGGSASDVFGSSSNSGSGSGSGAEGGGGGGGASRTPGRSGADGHAALSLANHKPAVSDDSPGAQYVKKRVPSPADDAMLKKALLVRIDLSLISTLFSYHRGVLYRLETFGQRFLSA